MVVEIPFAEDANDFQKLLRDKNIHYDYRVNPDNGKMFIYYLKITDLVHIQNVLINENGKVINKGEKLQMITPTELQQYEIENANIEAIIADIDKEIKRNHGKFVYESAMLTNEYPKSVRDEISRRYREAGWEYVTHSTSSEKGQRPGLTEFKLSMTPID